jgi:hypothetical protein
MYFARLTSNTKKWEFPSGPFGKCTNANLFEAQFGFGFEEWLMNKRNREGEFQYGYIQAFTAECHRGHFFKNVMLYTRIEINGVCTNYRVGVIKELYALQNQDLNGFLNDERVEAMRTDLNNVQLDTDEFDRQLGLNPPNIVLSPLNIINVKFKLADVKFEFDEHGTLPLENQIPHNVLVNRYRFKLYHRNV